MSLWIGLMSGTSMDGIDAVLMDDQDNKLISALTHPYSGLAKQALANLFSQPLDLGTLNQLSSFLGDEFADAVDALLIYSGTKAQDVIAIGSHGQTVAHSTNVSRPYTIQLGCPHTIAERSGITVVADFRTRDVVIGGQGAPFAPIYHQFLFGHLQETMAIVNIGGISNVTFLGEDGTLLAGYDVGPGNCLMDAWAQLHLGQPFDDQGNWAATGKVIPELLTYLLSDPYYQASAPKSLCTSSFALSHLSDVLEPSWLPNDVQATFLALTVTTIKDAVRVFAENYKPVVRLVICGGGARNRCLMSHLGSEQIYISLISSQDLGVDPDYLEAMMIAYLARKAYYAESVDLGMITGAKKMAILGAIYPKGLTR